MRTILAAALLAAFAVTLAAQDKKPDDKKPDDKKAEKKPDDKAGGKKLESKEGKFAVAFPRGEEPKPQVKTAGGLTQTFYVVEEKAKGGLMVSYGELPAEVLKAPKPEQVLESGEQGLKDYFKAKVTKATATTYGPKKLPAREIMAEKEDASGAWNVRGLLVLSGTRLYQVFAYGTKDFVTGKEADAFFASFEING